jgi:hypothetical protein
MSGSEMQREKEKVAAKMREKQAAGMFLPLQPFLCRIEAYLLTAFQPMRRKPLKPQLARRNRRNEDIEISGRKHQITRG